MSNLQDDLRSTEASIIRDAELVRALEEQKASLEPTDPRVERLSRQIEHLAIGLAAKTAAERELSEEVRSVG